MYTLDRYIASRFLRALFFSLLVFLAIYLIVDLVEHLDEFIDANATRGQVIRYYVNYVPYIVILTLPVSMLLATLFSMGTLSKLNELTAMKASGVSLYRMAAPLLVIGLLISLGSMAFAELVLPKTNQARWEVKNIEIQKQDPIRRSLVYNLYRQGDDGRVFRFERYDIVNHRGFGVLVQSFNGSSLTRALRADQMIWEDSVWVVKLGEERIFRDSDSVSVRSFDRAEMVGWTEKPEMFARTKKDPENMGYFELSELADTKRKAGADATPETVELYMKIAFPFSCFMMVLLGVPIAATPKRAGFAKSFGIAVGIGFVYFTATDVLQSLGKAGDISPFVAAWTMNLSFLIIDTLMFVFTRK